MQGLQELYDSITMLTPGESITYKGYTLQKVDAGGEISPPDHTELGVINREGKRVENLTVGAFDSFTEFKNRIDEIIEYDPDDMSDWLSR